MNDQAPDIEETKQQAKPSSTLPAMIELTLARLRENVRRPETLFWVYGFPIVMILVLGLAFQNKPIEKFYVDVESTRKGDPIVAALQADKRFEVRQDVAASARSRLRVGKTDVIVVPASQENSPVAYEFRYDPTQPRSMLARDAVNEILQETAGRKDPAKVNDVEMKEPGGRYIDFLVPGLLGMSLLGGGIWGVGFATVDMRIRKLLKRFVSTPMKKSHFLAAIMISRLLFLAPEMVVLLIFSRLVFGVVNYGSWLAVAVMILIGAVTFSGLGLLIATRAQTLEAASGLMNLVMLPMWLFSGIFFSPDRFPSQLQPIIHALPLTGLIGALRAIMLEGASLADVWRQIALLAAWSIVSFALALRFFKWT